jgi:hypothetical protein
MLLVRVCGEGNFRRRRQLAPYTFFNYVVLRFA